MCFTKIVVDKSQQIQCLSVGRSIVESCSGLPSTTGMNVEHSEPEKLDTKENSTSASSNTGAGVLDHSEPIIRTEAEWHGPGLTVELDC